LKEVVDTRFLVEHFYSNQIETKRKTAARLRELIENREGLLPTIVICEVVRVTCEKRGKEEAETRHLSLIRSGLQILELNQDIAKEAGLLKCRYENVALGDCIIAATAILNKARVLSDDQHFDEIKEVKRGWI
jgi:predicted nucleic acid-binding protein